MSGAMIVGELLRASAELVAIVPAERIKLGRLPDNTPLPAIVVRMVSGTERQPLTRGAWVRRTERVSVAVRAESYRQQKAIVRMFSAICVGVHADRPDARGVSILAAGIGPDVAGPADSYEQTQDFRASFDAPVKAAGA